MAVEAVDLLSQIHVDSVREDGIIEARVPMHLIYREDVPLNKAHVDKLEDNINQQAKAGVLTGQLQRILLGQVPDFPQFPIMDGFHRTDAQVRRQSPEMLSAIKPNVNWEEVYDHRIFCTSTNEEIQFARIVDWAEWLWQSTLWAQRGISLIQIAAVRAIPNMTGARLSLNKDEREEALNWLDTKCYKWEVPPKTLHDYLAMARGVDPDLIKTVRQGSGSGGGKVTTLNQSHIEMFGEILPGRYDLQNVLAEEVLKNSWSVRRAEMVAGAIALAETAEEAREIIASENWRQILPPKDTNHKDEELDPLSFPVLLRTFRERVKRSRNNLAYEVGVDPSYLTRIEHGDREPPTSQIIEALARALGLEGKEWELLHLSGGAVPSSVREALKRWDAVHSVIEIINSDLSDNEKGEYIQLINTINSRWQ